MLAEAAVVAVEAEQITLLIQELVVLVDQDMLQVVALAEAEKVDTEKQTVHLALLVPMAALVVLD